MANNTGIQHIQRNYPKGGKVGGPDCDCGHPELSHHTIEGMAIGECLYRGCECQAFATSCMEMQDAVPSVPDTLTTQGGNLGDEQGRPTGPAC